MTVLHLIPRREAWRYRELHLLEQTGEISNLQMQVKYELIPSQYELRPVTLKNGFVKMKKFCVEHACSYIADFVYIDTNGDTVVEDTKGFRNKGLHHKAEADALQTRHPDQGGVTRWEQISEIHIRL